MNKKKSYFKEDNKTSLNENTSINKSKNTNNEDINNKENSKNDNYFKKQRELISIKKVRGRQLKPQSSFNITKISNVSLSNSSVSKKRNGNKCKFLILLIKIFFIFSIFLFFIKKLILRRYC
jgi:hypothetical protein